MKYKGNSFTITCFLTLCIFFTIFVKLHTFFTLKCFSAQIEVMHKLKLLFLSKLVVKIFIITLYTSEACKHVSYHYSISTVEMNEIASSTMSTYALTRFYSNITRKKQRLYTPRCTFLFMLRLL